MALSANTLFHFTDHVDKLDGILKNEFMPKYCLENHSEFYFPIKLFGNYTERAVPMVCFCDIPLSQIHNHIEVYGGYAIGLKKSWGVTKQISPVMYTFPTSSSTDAIKRSFSSLLEQVIQQELELRKSKSDRTDNSHKVQLMIAENLERIVSYCKPYEGKLYRNGNLLNQQAKFYDEREWRFVPDQSLLDRFEIPSLLKKEEYLNVEERQKHESILSEKCRLTFEPDDIKYIIVNKEEEIMEMINKIRDIKSSKYEPDSVQKLITRIISLEQILVDF